jgi:hypothetical protein
MTADGTNPTPRVGETVLTAEELDALPVDTVVVDRASIPRTKRRADSVMGAGWTHAGRDPLSSKMLADGHPLTVLFRPDAPPSATVPDDAVERATEALFRHRYDMDDAECSCGWTLDETPVDEDGPLAEDVQVSANMARVALDAARVEEAEPVTPAPLDRLLADSVSMPRADGSEDTLAAARAGEAETFTVNEEAWPLLSAWFAIEERRAAAQRGGEAADREARETDDEQGVRLLRENRDYWRSLAESRTADLRDLRAALREALGITGPASDSDLMNALAARGGAAPTEVEWGVRVSNGSIQDGFGSRDEAASWAHDIEDGTLMQRDVSAWREVR